MRRSVRFACAAGAAVALAVTTAAPSEAQEIPDVPDLGFEIDPVEGPVGSTVNGLVDTDDVAEHCITDPEEFATGILDEEGPYVTAADEWLETLPDPDNPFPDPENDPRDFAVLVAAIFPLGLTLDPELAEDALAQTFIMAFADLETASPIDPLGNFDRNTGEGSSEVPDIEPGVHPVIATCVAIAEDLSGDDFGAAIDVAAAFIAANFETPYPIDFFGDGADEFAAAAAQVAPVLFQELVAPQALGFEFFCVFDETGECPEDEVPPVDDDDDDAPPAVAVVVDPDFTG